MAFTNTTGAPAAGVTLSLSVPVGWTSVVSGGSGTSKTFSEPVAPGASVSATFRVTSGPTTFNGDLVGKASWRHPATGAAQTETTAQKVRNVSPVTINEFRVNAGVPANSTDSFIELHNGSDRAVDISNWTLTHHPTQEPIFSSVAVPTGTTIAAKGFYLLGLANSGLAVPARKGDTTVHVRSTDGMAVGGTIEIGSGRTRETRRIVSVGTAAGAAPAGPPAGGGRPGAPGGATTVWQPLPDGPVITIPAGSTNVPVTAVNGFEVGQKMAIGHGATYPAVSRTVERYEVVTITAVGKPGTQAWLSADAKAGDTNIKVSSVANISVGDKIRLDVDTVGHGIETVTVTKVGTQSVRNTFAGPLKAGEDPGTGLDLAAPLKFNHASNMPFSVRGTGISFKPATAFAHSSNEPVLALGTGITLDKPLVGDHAIHSVVRDATVTTAGYQGTPAPNQWFGGPALSASAGTMVLRNAAGLVVDSLNYGLLVDPWAAEGYHGTSGAGEGGCRVPAPGAGARGGFGFGPAAAPVNTPHRSAGRLPDGRDTDSNCNDFLLQPASILSAAAAAGTTNIKVASVADFAAGQTILIDAGANLEKATIATVGTPGATTLRVATDAGATVIPVAGGMGFTAGQTITVDSGGNQETAVVASTGRGGPGGPGGGPGGATVTVKAPLKLAHAAGAQVSGSGITLTAALTRAHASGAQVATSLPTPGAPNQYSRPVRNR